MMMKNRKILSGFLATMCVFSLCACGQSGSTYVYEEDVELINPVGTSSSYEVPQFRNMYSYKISSGYIVPEVTEVSFETGQNFGSYGKFPGETVKKGDVIIYGNTENIDEQIKNKQEYIKNMETQYEESMKELQESLVEPKKTLALYQEAIDKMEKTKPAETIIVTDENGNPVEMENPSYREWRDEYNKVEPTYRDNLIATQKLEASISQKEELYNLDHAYQLKLLDQLKRDRMKCVASASTDGVVVKMTEYELYERGSYINKEVPVAAIGNMNVKEIHCDFINKATVTKAVDVYAFVNGKRYEVEYHPIDSEEYTKLSQDGAKVYSTFTFVEDSEEVQIGDFAVIVIVNDKRENTLSISKESLHSDSNGNYVYVLDGNDSVYTPVKVGLKDGLFVEILSGITQEDHILSEVSAVSGSTVKDVEVGNNHYSFKNNGHLYYPSGKYVTSGVEYGTTYFVESKVTRYQPVTKGQTLCTVRVVADSIGLKRNQTKLQRETERLNDLHNAYKNDKENKYYLKQVTQYEERIAELQKTINEMQADFKTTEIKAPTGGVIADMADVKADDLVNKDSVLYFIANDSTTFLSVEDTNHVLNYGNKVNISYKAADGSTQTASGTVCNVNAAGLSNEMRSDSVLISISEEDLVGMAASSEGYEGWWNRDRFTVTADVRSMDNVLTIPRKAVIENGGQTYVKVVGPDGNPMLVGFIAGGADNSYYWAIEGITEDMKICLE